MAKFESTLYTQYRIPYPSVLFQPLAPYCKGNGSRLIQVVDLGAGTGISSQSFLRFFPHAELCLVEPDSEMLREARALFSESPSDVQTVNCGAEDFVQKERADLILVGSAWHWFDFEKSSAVIAEALKPGGVVFVFEYQFPKAVLSGDRQIDDWVRREFNLRWKTENQRPRGSLEEITEPLRKHRELSQRNQMFIAETHSFSADKFWGFILSQSRYLAYEKQLNLREITEYRDRLRAEIEQFWGQRSEVQFSFPFEGYLFQRRML